MRSYTCSCASQHRRLRASAAGNSRFDFAANLTVIREEKGVSLFSAFAEVVTLSLYCDLSRPSALPPADGLEIYLACLRAQGETVDALLLRTHFDVKKMAQEHAELDPKPGEFDAYLAHVRDRYAELVNPPDKSRGMPLAEVVLGTKDAIDHAELLTLHSLRIAELRLSGLVLSLEQQDALRAFQDWVRDFLTAYYVEVLRRWKSEETSRRSPLADSVEKWAYVSEAGDTLDDIQLLIEGGGLEASMLPTQTLEEIKAYIEDLLKELHPLASEAFEEDLYSLASLFLEGVVCFDTVGWTYEELMRLIQWEEEADPQTP